MYTQPHIILMYCACPTVMVCIHIFWSFQVHNLEFSWLNFFKVCFRIYKLSSTPQLGTSSILYTLNEKH